ncbi:mRNA interferase [Lactococcus hodotermopsidis]|uniref:mRNA interferase n=1 Tax=Pseudolactococcus hodotermopsidis TaxID=2709157 RepID=A0A6A0BAH1_9LACT|nr:type II toxin-antitoxin system PemK/MazF family toxin [Lactococcus hodotermopsidis]GFH41633.1 mRNA interferase [Lactococcus hodotermopsidis]
MKYGEVYMVDFNPVVGSEQGNFRPVVIVSNDLYNRGTKMRVVIPISSVEKYGTEKKWLDYPLIQKVPEEQVVHGFALCNQYKTVDLRARKGQFKGAFSKEFVDRLALIVRSTIG